MKVVYFFNLVTIISARFCTETTELVCDSLNDLKEVEVSNGLLTTVLVVNKNNHQNTHLRHLSNSDLIKVGNFKFITINGVLNGLDEGALLAVSNATIINLRNNKINDINSGDFGNLTATELYLRNNSIKNINKGAFANLPNIRTIDLSDNGINVVPEGIFSNLKVHTLNLYNNNIFRIEDGAFHNTTYLSTVSLGGNKLTVFLSERLFDYATSITWLELQNNSLSYLGPETLSGMVSLKYFDISGNHLSVIQKDTFAETPHLEMLLLSRNKLVEIDPLSFPTDGLPGLFFLNVDHNRLTYLPRGFLRKLEGKTLKEMAMMGNPWRCECLNLLFVWMHRNGVKQNCYGENHYAMGKVPVCVVPDRDPNECHEIVDFHLVERYSEVLQKYQIPYCQV